MAAKSTTTIDLPDVSADRAMEVLSSPEFEIEQQAAQEGTVSTDVKEVSRTDDKVVYELHTVEYAKGVGGIDRSKKINTVTTVTWDLKRRTSSWTYDGPHGKRAIATGGTVITERGDGCRVQPTFNIEIKIPLVGGKVEKIVAGAAEKHWPAYERILRKLAADQ